MCEPGDPPIWKSTITILSPWNPYGVDVDVLAREALMGDCFLLSKVSEPAVPDEIAVAGDFFFPEAFSGNDYGEGGDGEGENPCLEIPLAPHEMERKHD
jgi:hypothetical protein